MRNKLLIEIYKKPQTVFTLKDVSLWFPEIPYYNLKKRLSYFARVGSIKKVRRGMYTKDTFNTYELANKLYTPSYISLETVLRKAGVTFQYYERIFAISYVRREIEVGEITIQYRRIKKEILFNKEGIEEENNAFVATAERAFLDAVYLYKNYHFDNLSTLNWDKIMELKDIYESPVFAKRVEEYYQIHKEEDYA